MKKILPYLSITLLVIIFFWQFFIKGLFPIPADTIIGLYHPFRDLYAKDYPNGIPFKNFLITDPVRQQYPWRELAISAEKRLELPLWNPYNFSGTPLLANFQSASFYPLNILFFVMPFTIAWSLIIFLGPLLAGLFLFLYLNNLKLNKWACLLGAIAFSFSGFFISWLEWGTITHVAPWLPLILLCVDKIFSNIRLKSKNLIIWSLIFIISLISSFFAGHLQAFFYLFIFSWFYFLARWIQFGKEKKVVANFIILNSLFIILTSIQWIPTIQFIALSARNIDVVDFNNPGWFIPWQHLIQFVVPDFFGNPTTLNYWGVWNYGELIGYVGIIPLILALFSLFFRRDKKTFFFGTVLFSSLFFSLPTFLAKIPYLLKIPFFDTAQPTRLLFIITFSLAVLSALGLDYFIRIKKREILYPLIFLSLIIATLWALVLFGNNMIKLISLENLSVVKNNLIFPSMIFFVSAMLIILFMIFYNTKISTLILCCIIVVTMFDLLRFGLKFSPFTNQEYLFPQTKTLEFLQKNLGYARIMATDSRILPPNFSTIYRLQTVDGYDPLYLQRYAELIAASERKKADINPPFGFNRIITPYDYDSEIIDLLGVKFVLSLSDLDSPKLKKVFQEGETRIYQNTAVLPRSFFIEQIKSAANKKEAINMMFDKDFDPRRTAIVEESRGVLNNTLLRCTDCEAKIISYTDNRIIVEVENKNEGFLVLTDSFYPTWKAKIDTKNARIYKTDYNFRGIKVPPGRHRIKFYMTLL